MTELNNDCIIALFLSSLFSNCVIIVSHFTQLSHLLFSGRYKIDAKTVPRACPTSHDGYVIYSARRYQGKACDIVSIKLGSIQRNIAFTLGFKIKLLSTKGKLTFWIMYGKNQASKKAILITYDVQSGMIYAYGRGNHLCDFKLKKEYMFNLGIDFDISDNSLVIRNRGNSE